MKPEILVGKIKSAHGLKGEVYILIFSHDTSWNPNLKTLTLKNLKNEFKSYQVLKSKPHKEGLIATLEGVTDRNQSEDLIGLEVHIPTQLLESKKGETIYLKEILGFDVQVEGQSVGLVDSFSSNGSQDLIVIKNQDHRFEVPFVEQFIVKMDFENSKILMDFPLDLIELNRKSNN
jgi:16S rRNA processing protein RimM